jgi:hypothetical protein
MFAFIVLGILLLSPLFKLPFCLFILLVDILLRLFWLLIVHVFKVFFRVLVALFEGLQAIESLLNSLKSQFISTNFNVGMILEGHLQVLLLERRLIYNFIGVNVHLFESLF